MRRGPDWPEDSNHTAAAFHAGRFEAWPSILRYSVQSACQSLTLTAGMAFHDPLKKREPILIHMEILASLFDSPKSLTRLAQACNVNFGRIDRFTEPLMAKGLVKIAESEGLKLYSITEEGYRVYTDWLEIWRRLPLE